MSYSKLLAATSVILAGTMLPAFAGAPEWSHASDKGFAMSSTTRNGHDIGRGHAKNKDNPGHSRHGHFDDGDGGAEPPPDDGRDDGGDDGGPLDGGR